MDLLSLRNQVKKCRYAHFYGFTMDIRPRIMRELMWKNVVTDVVHLLPGEIISKLILYAEYLIPV